MAVAMVNYAYKVVMAFGLIPLIYLVRKGIHAYLGEDVAHHLQAEARST
jgi:hypothetical protein